MVSYHCTLYVGHSRTLYAPNQVVNLYTLSNRFIILWHKPVGVIHIGDEWIKIPLIHQLMIINTSHYIIGLLPNMTHLWLTFQLVLGVNSSITTIVLIKQTTIYVSVSNTSLVISEVSFGAIYPKNHLVMDITSSSLPLLHTQFRITLLLK